MDISRETMVETYGLPEEPTDLCTVISDNTVDEWRWGTVHEVIFQIKGEPSDQAWSASYRRGSDMSPWEGDDEVYVTKMMLRPVMTWVESSKAESMTVLTVIQAGDVQIMPSNDEPLPQARAESGAILIGSPREVSGAAKMLYSRVALVKLPDSMQSTRGDK